MEKINYRGLSVLYNRTFVRKIISNNYKNYLENILSRSNYLVKEVSLVHVLDSLYSEFKKNYKCEYVYKNTIVNKILLGRHSLNTSTLISELNVGKSKADIVIFNGTSTVYEIKTELDSLNRLEAQLEDYLKCFDKIYVITTLENIKKLENKLSGKIGLIEYTKRGTLREHKKAESNKRNIDKKSLFSLFRKNEMLNIIKKIGFEIPDVHPRYLREECEKIFLKLSNEEAHNIAIEEIKKRKIKNEQKEIIEMAPESLKFFFLAENLNKKQCKFLKELLFN
jgi:CII phage-related protein|nr:MAG TPA: DNA repair protein MmcB-like protein [Caudoviricetes sp.]DAX27868.1 MAG TPA: DNA repair protein MmcB-like protein [Caudoviricetes sp.]